MTKPTISQLWKRFQCDSIPETAPRIQHLEMRKAFYAGAASLLAELKAIDDNLSEDEGVEILEGYEAEIIGFFCLAKTYSEEEIVMTKGFGRNAPKIQDHSLVDAANLLVEIARRAGKPLILPMFPQGNVVGLNPGELRPGNPVEIPPGSDGVVAAIACSSEEAQELVDLITKWQQQRLKKEDDRNA